MNPMSAVAQDLRYALRLLWKSPGFTAAAIIALALGIGANTAIFSVVNSVLRRPLPFRDANRMVVVWESNQAQGMNRSIGGIRASHSTIWRFSNRALGR
jgi:putative ABC transport system permease protein